MADEVTAHHHLPETEGQTMAEEGTDPGTAPTGGDGGGLSATALDQVKELIKESLGAADKAPARREGREVLAKKFERDEQVGDQIEAALERIQAKDAHAKKEADRDNDIAELKKRITQTPPKTYSKLQEWFFGKDPD